MTNDALTALDALKRLLEIHHGHDSYANLKFNYGNGSADWLPGARKVAEDSLSTIRQAIKSLEEERRMCVSCGRTRPASEGRITPGDDCPSPEACTWDHTPDEAWQHWRKEAHDLRVKCDNFKSALAEACEVVKIAATIAADYMSSENHHPSHVLIPALVFEQIRDGASQYLEKMKQ